MSAAWENFVASLDVEELRREHMRVHGDLDAERFGSREHHEMVHAHEFIAADFWRRIRGEITDVERAAMRRRFRLRDERIAEAARSDYEQRLRERRLLELDDEEIAELAEYHRTHPRGETA